MAEHLRSHFVTISSSRGSITLPAEVRQPHRLDEPGEPGIRWRRVGGHAIFSAP